MNVGSTFRITPEDARHTLIVTVCNQQRRYSWRSASTGSMFAARQAG